MPVVSSWQIFFEKVGVTLIEFCSIIESLKDPCTEAHCHLSSLMNDDMNVVLIIKQQGKIKQVLTILKAKPKFASAEKMC